MAEISNETGRQIGVLIDRKGHIEYVMVGDAKRIEMPDFGRVRVGLERFRGLRCVHTHLAGEPLTQDDLTDLALLRLDLMSVIQVDRRNGLPGQILSAHILPGKRRANGQTEDGTDVAPSLSFAFLEPATAHRLEIDFEDLIRSLEAEMARVSGSVRPGVKLRERAILVGVADDLAGDAEDSLVELAELADSAGLDVADAIIQRRRQIDPKTLIGRGKLDELLIRSMQLGADILVFDRELTPAQVRALSEVTDLKILDRPQLILDIFAQRAQSREGKLQVELAQLKYMLPRLILGQNSAFSRLAGGIGGRGPGETKLETDRRRVRDRIVYLEKQVSDLGRQRSERRKRRANRSVPIISLVGYTNAGKSTLLNTLTQSSVYSEQKMFATLDPTSRRLRLPYDQEVVINDTVGFIRDLPETLVAAFRATLEEISQSDLLVHLVDASNPQALNQVASVERILADLGLDSIPQIIALNKTDIADPQTVAALRRTLELDRKADSVAISAIDKRSLVALAERIGTKFMHFSPNGSEAAYNHL
ncbi:MAG: GTPase HflX [Pyrinomonadaceae bacterium]|jgi:GTP-binding protein HflX